MSRFLLLLTVILLFLNLIVFALLAVLWLQPALLPNPGTAAIQVAFVAPQEGVVCQMGRELLLQAIAGSPAGVRQVELWEDNAPVLTAENPDPKGQNPWPVNLLWRSAALGTHALQLKALSTTGQTAMSAPITVTVVPSGTIAFASNRSGNYDIYLMSTDGLEVQRLTADPSDDRSPAWGPEGTLLFVSDRRAGDRNIWRMQADGRGQIPLTNHPASDYMPAWSPVAKRIAFVSNRDGNDEIYLLEADGSNPRRLTFNEAYDGQPSWSPLGDRLAFTSNRGGNWDIYTIDSNGAGLTRLTQDPARDWYPAWSPTGRHIAFVSDRSGTNQLYLMNAQGGNIQQLTDLPGGVEHPTWSPDGAWLAFVAYTGQGGGVNMREIYLISVAGGQPVRLTANADDDSEPAWYRPPMPLAPGAPVPTPPPVGFLAQYYNNMTLSGEPALYRTDPAIDFRWDNRSPGPGVKQERFSVRWTGQVEVASEGDYLFSVTVAGGLRLWVDGALLLDRWYDQPPVTYTIPVRLGVGEHSLRLEYYCSRNPGLVRLYWEPGIK